MKDQWDSNQGLAGFDWIRQEMRQAFEGASILIVEDDRDIRDLLVTLLQLAGYSTTACGTAEEGLNALREGTFDFVLTDYALPNRTGGWLLRQAQAEGLLDSTPTLVVTAHPNPPDLDGFDIVHKPFDLDDLVAHVRQRLDDSGPKRQPISHAQRGGQDGNRGSGDNACPEPIELVLYVNGESPSANSNAFSDIKRVLAARYRSDKVTLTICELEKPSSSESVDTSPSASTPVKRSPGPRTCILGHMSNPDLLIELLDGCDIES